MTAGGVVGISNYCRNGTVAYCGFAVPVGLLLGLLRKEGNCGFAPVTVPGVVRFCPMLALGATLHVYSMAADPRLFSNSKFTGDVVVFGHIDISAGFLTIGIGFTVMV